MTDSKVEPILSVIGDRDNATLLAKVATLWIKPSDLVMDATWGEGKWWTKYKPARFIAHDLYTLDGVDFTNLPEEDGSVDVVAFDPPYTSKGGRETSGIQEMDAAYGLKDAPATPSELNKLIGSGLEEVNRVLRPKVRGGQGKKGHPGGIVLIKCADYVSSGRMVLGHAFVVNTCLKLGMEIVDEFVHWSGTGPQPGENITCPHKKRVGQKCKECGGKPKLTKRTQVHSRRAHSFLIVARKDGKPQEVL